MLQFIFALSISSHSFPKLFSKATTSLPKATIFAGEKIKRPKHQSARTSASQKPRPIAKSHQMAGCWMLYMSVQIFFGTPLEARFPQVGGYKSCFWWFLVVKFTLPTHLISSPSDLLFGIASNVKQQNQEKSVTIWKSADIPTCFTNDPVKSWQNLSWKHEKVSLFHQNCGSKLPLRWCASCCDFLRCTHHSNTNRR